MPHAVNKTVAVARRVLRQLGRDRRFLALSLLVPLAIIYVTKIFFDSTAAPPESTPPPIEEVLPFLQSLQVPPTEIPNITETLQPIMAKRQASRINPTQIAVPIGAFFIHFITYLLCAIVLVRERTAQTLQRMFVNGYRQAEIIGGYVLAYTTLATLQSLLVLADLTWLFKLDYGLTKLLSIYLVFWLLAVISIALGILVSNFCRTEGQVLPFVPLVAIPSVFLSGLIISADKLPTWAQWLSHVVPLYYANQVLQKLIEPAGGLRDAWLGLTALPIYGLAVLFLATRTLREVD